MISDVFRGYFRVCLLEKKKYSSMWYFGSEEIDEENNSQQNRSNSNNTPNGKRKVKPDSTSTSPISLPQSGNIISNVTTLNHQLKQQKQESYQKKSNTQESKIDLDDEVFTLELSPEYTNRTRKRDSIAQPIDEQLIEQRKVVSNFLEEHKCYSVIPESGKIVVLDIALAVKSAFHALEENSIKSAPLWDSIVQDYVGIITVTDFIEILLHFHRVPNVNLFEELEKHQIKTWRDIISKERSSNSLISIDPEDTLYDASKTLLKYRIHRLPIIDRAESNTILHIVTHYRILLFVMEKLKEKPSFFSYSIGSLGIGTYKNVVTILKDTPLNVTLTLLAERKISAVPVVDENGSVIDVYTKSDVLALVKQVTVLNFLDKPMSQILQYKKVLPIQQ